MRVCLIIIAFGEPESKLKLKILQNNITKIKQYVSNLDIHLNLYTNDSELKNKILAIDQNIVINESKGYLLELLFKFNQPEKYIDYDHIILLLDDVEILNVDFNDLFETQKKYNLDILSTRILGASHDMMSKYHTGLYYLVNMEFYMYVLTPQSYKRYFEQFDKSHITMWGYDFALFYGSNLKVAINYQYACSHYLRTTKAPNIGNREFNEISKKMGITLYSQANPVMPLDKCDSEHYIKRAFYGTCDVTEKIRKLYDNGIRHIECSNDVFGDPNYGFYKYLVVLYNNNKIDVALEKSICKFVHHKDIIEL